MTTARSLHEIATELRRVADLLDAADTAIPATDVTIDLQVLSRAAGGDDVPTAGRVAAVNAVAAAVGTEPSTDPTGEQYAHHRSRAYGNHDSPVLAFTSIAQDGGAQ